MEAVRVRAECAQCGRPVPTDPTELEGWRHADLAAAGELDEVAAAISRVVAEGRRASEIVTRIRAFLKKKPAQHRPQVCSEGIDT